MNSSTPLDEELLQAVTQLRQLHPHLGRAKVLSFLKDTNSWALSEQRLKKCLDQNNLNAKPENENDLPRDDSFQTIIKAAFIDFKIRERNFLLALSKSQSLKFSGGNHSDPMFAACHQRHHIEVLFVLKKIKLCALFAHYTAQEIFTEMVQQCLKPVVQQYKLLRYGSLLAQITHPMPTTIHRGFQNGWIFADLRSSVWPEVNKLFLTPNEGQLMTSVLEWR